MNIRLALPLSICTCLISTPRAQNQTTWTSFDDRLSHSLIAASGTTQLLLFGGESIGSSLSLGDTWNTDVLGNWVNADPRGGPCARRNHAMGAVQMGGSPMAIMFGGESTKLHSDTWEWSGSGWTLCSVSPSQPSARSGHAMASHLAANLIVMFGGNGGGFPLGDTWTFDGANWSQMFPAQSPGARFGHSMAWDGFSQNVVMFGGSGFLTDTWEYSHANSSWTQRTTLPANTPRGRVDAAMAYYPLFNQLLLFGGRDNTQSPLADTWLWNTAAQQWTVPPGLTTSPPARFGHAITNDAATSMLVMVGGEGLNSQPLSGVWEWNGVDWARRSPPPSSRSAAPFAHDVTNSVTMLFGGVEVSTGTELGDTWELNSTTWTEKHPVNAPSPRLHHGLAHDTARARTILFGGRTANGNCASATNETWEWDGTNWLLISTPTSPPLTQGSPLVYDPVRDRTVCLTNGETWLYDGNVSTWEKARLVGPRTQAACEFDSNRQRVILYGGVEGRGIAALDTTWEWDGSQWLELTPVSNPGDRLGHNLANDTTRKRLVLFGGEMSGTTPTDTWEWDGTTWTMVSSVGPAPSGRRRHAMVFDSLRNRIVLFGGYQSPPHSTFANDTWSWDGSTWTDLQPASSPSIRGRHAMAYDSSRDRIVMFGGVDTQSSVSGRSDTWEFDGSVWVQQNPVTVPRARSSFSMVYDAQQGCIVMFGGDSPNGAVLNDTWTWDGTDWRLLPSITKPEGRSAAAQMAFDTARSRTVLFAGGKFGNFLEDTWEFDCTNWELASEAGSPGNRALHSMAWDSLRQTVLLFGGQDSACNPGAYMNDTWEWDGTGWSQHNSSAAPSPRSGSGLAFDTTRSAMVLYGGTGASGTAADTWEWNGTQWSQVFPDRSPGPLSSQGMAFDTLRQRTVLLDQLGVTWDFGVTENSAQFAIYAAGCAGSGGTPSIGVAPGNGAWIGKSLTFDLTSLPGSNITVLLFGVAPTSIPLAPLLPVGCNLLVNSIGSANVNNVAGVGSIPIRIPDRCFLVGVEVFFQSVSIDPPQLAVVGPGVKITIGAK